METKQLRKTLGMKCSNQFYDVVTQFVNERGMTVSSLIRMALKNTYGLEEIPIERKNKKAGLPE